MNSSSIFQSLFVFGISPFALMIVCIQMKLVLDFYLFCVCACTLLIKMDETLLEMTLC